MMICLKNGRVIDPAHDRDAIGDVYIRDDRISAAPDPGIEPDETYDVSGKIVMAGGIDLHSHIASGNVGIARLLMPELCISETVAPPGAPLATARWSAAETGRLYAEMGFTTVVEPAIAPSLALRAHLELEDIPIIDRAGLVVLGNNDYLLELLRSRESDDAICDYVGWVLDMSRCLGVKVINPGGAAAFKENVRHFDLDDIVPSYGVTSRDILTALHRSVLALGVPHPLHVHCNNLGIPGNGPDSVLATARAAEDRPMHLAHVQFYAYDPARGGIRSAAARIVDGLAAEPAISVDVGQVMFGQTVTISLDVLRQFSARDTARPRKWVVWEGDEGCGILPFDYKSKNPGNALQWTAGLEIFLLTADPWRVFFTTDHPNGAPFTTYPKILHLLMDANERGRWMETLPPIALRRTELPSITREYSLNEVAILTRASPARRLGLDDRGHLGPGALADVAVYSDQPNRTAMFQAAHLVFKSGELVVRDGVVVKWPRGRTQIVKPSYDRKIVERVARYAESTNWYSPEDYAVPENALGRENIFQEHPCRT